MLVEFLRRLATMLGEVRMEKGRHSCQTEMGEARTAIQELKDSLN